MATGLKPGSRDYVFQCLAENVISKLYYHRAQLISPHIIHTIDLCWMNESSEWVLPSCGVSGGTGWLWTSHGSPFNPRVPLMAPYREQDISFNFNFYFKCISQIFGEILSTTYLDSKWGEGRGGGGARSHNQARHKQRLWICKRPIHQKSECLIFRNG